MQKPVLLVIDMQNDFLERWEPPSRKRLTGAINELTSLFRKAGCPVVWIRQEFEPDLRDAFPEMKAAGIVMNIRGTPGCKIVPELTVREGERVLIKKRYSAFFRTDLDAVLAELEVETIVLSGINTHACIRMAAIDAYQRDWPVVLAAECIDSYDQEHHEVSLRYMRGKIASVMTNVEIGEGLFQARKG